MLTKPSINTLKNKQNNATDLTFKDDGSPFSKQFNDIYFDTSAGFEQSDFVFIKSNHIEQRIKQSQQVFTVFETGFGTGLNFLLTLQAYKKILNQNKSNKNAQSIAPLHFISVEKYPLTQNQLIKTLSILPKLAEFSALLIPQYSCEIKSSTKNNVQKMVATFFDNQVTLTIIFNDATLALSQIKSPKTGLVDAWYLDGFSPAKNPDMWSNELFSQIGRLSKEQSTLTTFTVAGSVKRKLRNIGFRLHKKQAPGEKKEMYYGVFQSGSATDKGYQLRPKIIKPQHVSIIGGGIASACLAYLLTKQGVKVTLYCQDSSVAQGGSSNAIGALYPLLHQKIDDISLFYQQAFWRAKTLYQEVFAQGFEFNHNWCGLLEVSYRESLAKRQQLFTKLATWPPELIHGVNAEQASRISGMNLTQGGLFMPNAGWAAPQALVKAIFNAAQATNRLQLKTQTKIIKIREIDPAQKKTKNASEAEQALWTISSDKESFQASVLIVCGGAEAIDLEIVNKLPLTSTRGQVTSMKTNSHIQKLSTVICHKGYLTPENKGIHCIGATFDKNNTNTVANTADDNYNLSMLNKCLPELSAKISWKKEDISSSKARLRCMTPDHLPLVGAMPDIPAHINAYPHLAKDKNWKYHQAAPVLNKLYVMTGFGARGLCSAPLAADILSADLCGTPYPVNNQMLFNLSPNRFIIRDIVRRKVNT
ncbi:MAG: bifunctional tRNA (5-methylaminomethyl-2-thiouridine)(34)-methyltransferase MnmD/FAD-dependent 5-carboxymethylaminomethyl-2-thiouridine(34) oxidoreductase MnmC [Colwellia sp.]